MSIPSAPENNQQTASGRATVTADDTFPVFVSRGTCRVESANVMVHANIATNATDFATVSLINGGTDAAGTTVVGTGISFETATDGGVAFTKNVPKAFSIVDGAQELTDGQVLLVNWDEATTDVADATITAQVRYTQITPPDQS